MQNSSFKIWASLGVTAISGLLAYNILKKSSKHHKTDQFKPVWCLLGDVGGTNIRLQLSLVKPPLNQPLVINKTDNLRVADFESLEAAIQSFLSDVEKLLYPQLAVIGIAGVVRGNLVEMSNVPKWGQFNAEQIATSLKFRQLFFMNDFVLNSYGLQLVDQDHLVQVNGLPIDKKKLRGVLGPGTGLGTSTLYPAPFRNRERIYVIAAEGGHVDCTYIDQQTEALQKFIKKQKNLAHLRLQDIICGPAIPYLYKFVSKSDELLTSEAIIKKIIETDRQHLENTTQGKFLKLYLRLYGSAIGNFISVHMCSGGVYLVGSITNALIPFLQNKKDFIDEFIGRHPEIASTLRKVPIVISKQINLGLKGAFYYARRIVSDEQYKDVHHD